MLMLEPASILTLESFRRLPPIVHKGNPGLDLANALFQGLRLDAASSFGAAWYIPTFFVPLLLVTHFMIFARLLKRGT